jgi:nitrate reductase NapAB chaperone NapD
MAIASMIVQPAANSLQQVAEQLAFVNGVTVHSTKSNQEIIIVVEAPSLDAISAVARTIEAISGVLSVLPAYVTVADEDN